MNQWSHFFQKQIEYYKSGLRFPIRMIVSDEMRSMRENMCWLPLKLNTRQIYDVDRIMAGISRENMLVLDTGYMILNKKSKIIYYLVKNNADGKNLYLILSITKKYKVLGTIYYLTHYEGIEYHNFDNIREQLKGYISDNIYKLDPTDLIIKIGTRKDNHMDNLKNKKKQYGNLKIIRTMIANYDEKCKYIKGNIN